MLHAITTCCPFALKKFYIPCIADVIALSDGDTETETPRKKKKICLKEAKPRARFQAMWVEQFESIGK